LYDDDYSTHNRENIQPNTFMNGDDLGNTYGIDFEVKKISSKEEELMKKARDLENEMR
jgi:hypothetical protein